MSTFDRLDRQAQRTVDRVNTERFRLTPMKPADDPNARPVFDPARIAFISRGILDLDPTPAPIEFGPRRIARGSNDLVTLQNGRSIVLSVSADQFAHQVRQGDKVEMIERCDLPALHVAEIKPDGMGRIELVLTR